MLWRFTSLFSDKDEKQLQKLYKYIKRNKMQKFQVSKQDDSLPQQLSCCPHHHGLQLQEQFTDPMLPVMLYRPTLILSCM